MSSPAWLLLAAIVLGVVGLVSASPILLVLAVAALIGMYVIGNRILFGDGVDPLKRIAPRSAGPTAGIPGRARTHPLQQPQAQNPQPVDLDQVLQDVAGERVDAVNEVFNWAAKMSLHDAATVMTATMFDPEGVVGWVNRDTAYASIAGTAPSPYTEELQAALTALDRQVQRLDPQHRLAFAAGVPELMRHYVRRAGVNTEGDAKDIAQYLSIWATAFALADRLPPQHAALLTAPWRRVQEKGRTSA